MFALHRQTKSINFLTVPFFYPRERVGERISIQPQIDKLVRRALAGEFLGTAFMVGVGCGSVALGANHVVVSLCFGVAVTLAILVVGPWSGAHINPAVTVAFWRDGQLPGERVIPYMVAQCSGAFAAAVAVQGAAPTTLSPKLSLFEGFMVEVTITLALMISILLVVQRTSSRTVIAFVVGITVAILALIAGSHTGASMNPARTFGPNMYAGLGHSILFYSLATTLGAWFACDIKRRFFPDATVNSVRNI